ncbi:cell division control protein 6 [Methanocalculus alkaliphilus]|uniref:ORC1-type DNA replication protein n=1 Tax=Methanocalculus alkaliphilus TaxID=768730 RepID=UPI0020A1F4E9|nr:cell division control protein 6 [Methanocalculus alkaliphilus]
MVKRLLMWDETIFRDPEVFEMDFVPDQFFFRENQTADLAFQIQPGLRGGRPLNSFCRGPPGTGKTTTVKKLFAEIEETTKRLVPVHVNCQIDNTRYAIIAKVYKQLAGHPPQPSGTSFKQVYEAVCRRIQKEDIVLIICLDDANYLLHDNEINNILYPLLRAHEAYENARVGLIIIFSDMDIDIAAAVDSRVASVLRTTEVPFPPYTAAEVEEILRMRVSQGFYPNVISEDVFQLVVDRTMRGGDLRAGIDLLKRAGFLAERDARRTVTRDDVCKAYEVSQRYHLTSILRSLRDEEKAVLAVIAEMSGEGAGTAAGEVHAALKKDMKLSYTRYYEIIRKLDMLRLINLDYRIGRGRTRVISLRYDPGIVLDLL